MTIDPVTVAVGTTAVAWITPAAQEFFKKIGAPLGDVAASITDRFAQNLNRTVTDADQKLSSAGKQAGEVHPRTLLPLLEGASREEDVALADLWASLLANAADSSTGDMPPRFVNILKQLTPTDARVLTTIEALGELGTSSSDEGWSGPFHGPRIKKDDLFAEISGDPSPPTDVVEPFELSLDTLAGLRLIEKGPSFYDTASFLETMSGEQVALTSGGRRFIAACKAPVQATGQ